MTRRAIAALIVMLALLAMTGCEPKLAPTIRPNSGDAYRVGVSVVHKLYLTIQDVERTQTVNINVDGDWRFTTVAKGHTADLAFTLSSLSLRRASADGVLEYAVRTPPGDSATVPSGYTRAFEQYPLTLRLGGAGALEMVEGAQPLLNALRAEPDLADRTDNGELDGELAKILSDRALADTLGVMFDVLPPKKSRAGAEWDTTGEIYFELVPVTTRSRLSLRTLIGGQARVETKTEYAGESSGGFGASNLRFGAGGIKGQGGGAVMISLDTGLATRADVSAEYRGEVSVYGNPHLNPNDFYPFRLERTISIHAVPVAMQIEKPKEKSESRRANQGPDFSAPVPSDD
ncbi:MAG: hypothetical protein KJ042_10880 [Deltaproteobacteria bacterium]|nr:hypothetical protein [Deltaproteobacteria bacterium]